MLRHIPLGQMYNLRDLGGYPVPGGGETAWERLLRGDNPEGLSQADLRWLLDRDITTVVDLRSGADQAQARSALHPARCSLFPLSPPGGGGRHAQSGGRRGPGLFPDAGRL